MAQFSVYRNPRASARHAPYLLDVQTDLFSSPLRVVIPLVRLDYFGPPARRLNPVFAVEGESFVLSPNEIGSLPTKMLGAPVCSLAASRSDITNAMDFLLLGI